MIILQSFPTGVFFSCTSMDMVNQAARLGNMSKLIQRKLTGGQFQVIRQHWGYVLSLDLNTLG